MTKIILLLVFMFPNISLAQDFGDKKDSKQRAIRKEARQNGDINHKEAKRLRKMERRQDAFQEKAAADGVITKKERKRNRKMQKRQNRRMHKMKNN